MADYNKGFTDSVPTFKDNIDFAGIDNVGGLGSGAAAKAPAQADLLGGFNDSPKPFGSPAPAVSPTPISSPAPSKQLDFGMANAPATPSTPFTAIGGQSSDVVDYNQFVKDTLLWNHRVRSAFYFLLGLGQILFFNHTFTAKTPAITAVCYVLLANLGLNFLRCLISTKAQERAAWSSSSITQGVIYLFTQTVQGAAAILDKHLSALDPYKTLKVAIGLWVLSLLGKAVSASHLLLAVHLAAFTIPLAYTKFQTSIDKTVNDVWAQAKGQIDTLDRKAKVALLGGPPLLVAFFLSYLDLSIAVLIVLIYARTMLRPTEVDAVSKKVAPYTATAVKISSRITGLAADVSDRFDLTPTPMKKKLA